MPVRYARPYPSALCLAVALVAALALFASAAGAAPKKPYTVELTPATVPAGSTRTLTLVLKNVAGTQQLGSANVKVPAAFVISTATPPTTTGGTVAVTAGNILALRELALDPGEQVTVKVTVTVPCAYDAAADRWSISAKQSNDYNGTGNDVGPVDGTLSTTLAPACGLRFAAGRQPNTTLAQQQVRAGELSSGDPVAVEAVDGSGTAIASLYNGPISIILSNTTSSGQLLPMSPVTVNAFAGVASYPDLRVTASGTYRLRASTTAPGFVVYDTDDQSPLSGSFSIVDSADDCTATKCTGTRNGALTRLTVTGQPGTGTGRVLLSFRAGAQPDCTNFLSGFKHPTSDYYEYTVTAPGAKTAALLYSKEAMKSVKSANALQACLAAPFLFTTAPGSRVAQPFDYDGDPLTGSQGKEGFVGLLPDCPVLPACVSGRDNAPGGTAVLSVFLAAGEQDPRLH